MGPLWRRGDKDVKKDLIKTSRPALDFLEKKISIIIFNLEHQGKKKLSLKLS
jgi:hypothetical protein